MVVYGENKVDFIRNKVKYCVVNIYTLDIPSTNVPLHEISLKGPSPKCSRPLYPIRDETHLDKVLELRTYYGFVDFGMRYSTQVAGGICLHCATESEKFQLSEEVGRINGTLFEVKSCRNTKTLKTLFSSRLTELPIFSYVRAYLCACAGQNLCTCVSVSMCSCCGQ